MPVCCLNDLAVFRKNGHCHVRRNVEIVFVDVVQPRSVDALLVHVVHSPNSTPLVGLCLGNRIWAEELSLLSPSGGLPCNQWFGQPVDEPSRALGALLKVLLVLLAPLVFVILFVLIGLAPNLLVPLVHV